jgi:hypothetical protein
MEPFVLSDFEITLLAVASLLEFIQNPVTAVIDLVYVLLDLVFNISFLLRPA